MNFRKEISRNIKNIFRSVAASLKSGEMYQGGRIVGYHYAGYKREEKDGTITEISAKNYKVTGIYGGGRVLVLKDEPLSPGSR